jgi:hypothetical protein
MANSVNLNKQAHGLVLQTETLAPAASADGSFATPTKTLLDTDSGLVMFCNAAAASIVIQLPTVAAGLNFRVIAAVGSNNIANKDIVVYTGDDDVDINGNVAVAGGHIEVLTTSSVVAMDGSTGPLTAGDWLDLYCDGTDWYVQGSAVESGAIVLGAASSDFTVD